MLLGEVSGNRKNDDCLKVHFHKLISVVVVTANIHLHSQLAPAPKHVFPQSELTP